MGKLIPALLIALIALTGMAAPNWNEILGPSRASATNSAPYRAGLRGSDIVTAVNGVSTNLVGRPFLVWFRQQYDAGDRVTLSVRNQGKDKEVSYQLSEADH